MTGPFPVNDGTVVVGEIQVYTIGLPVNIPKSVNVPPQLLLMVPVLSIAPELVIVPEL